MTNEVFANSPVPGTVSAIGTLASNVSSSATTWTLNAALPAVLQSGGQFHALVDHEIVVIPTQTGTSLTGITRGSSLASPDTCTSSAHSAGASIYPLLTAGALENALAAAGGGGSTAVATFTNVSTAQTLNSFVTDPMQIVEMTGNPVITIPSGPAGAECSGVIEFVQDSTGGRVWSYSGSVYQPGGPPNPGAAATLSDYVFVQWDGAMWAAFPATSGPAVISVLGILIEGGVAGLTPTRQLGSQATGTAPPYTPLTANFELVPDSGLSGGFGYWYSPVGSTTWSSFTGGSGASGVVVSSPTNFDTPGYNQASTDWVGLTSKYYDITAPPFNVATTGDNTYAINNAMFQLSQHGIVPWLPPSATPYPCTTQGYMGIVGGVVQPVPSGTSGAWAPGGVILFSNGVPNGTVVSGTTFTNGQDATYISQIEGGYPTVGNGKASKPINAPISETIIQWGGGTAYSGSLLMVLGPTSSGGAKNIRFDGNSTYAKGPLTSMTVLSARSMKWPGVSISNCINGLICNTVQCTAATATNCVDNDFDDLFVQFTGQSSPPAPNGSSASYSYGVLLGYDGHVGANSCYNRFNHLSIIGGSTNASGHSSPICYGFVFQGCDSNTVDFSDMSASACTVPIVMDYSASNGGQWPAGNTMTVVETGGINNTAEGGVAVKNIGSPSGAYANAVLRVSQVNGYAPDPQLTNLIWDTPGIKGRAQLASGAATLTGHGSEFANAFGSGGTGTMQTYMITPGGTPSAYYLPSYSGSTMTLTGYTSGGSVNTADTSFVGWVLID